MNLVKLLGRIDSLLLEEREELKNILIELTENDDRRVRWNIRVYKT